MQQWRARDPVTRFQNFIVAHGWWSEAQEKQLRVATRKEVCSTYTSTACITLLVFEMFWTVQSDQHLWPKQSMWDLLSRDDVMPSHADKRQRAQKHGLCKDMYLVREAQPTALS